MPKPANCKKSQYERAPAMMPRPLLCLSGAMDVAPLV